MVLLQVLYQLSPENGWRLTVAHLNHQLRGRSSDGDERLVRRTAERLKLPLVVERADVRRFARERKISLEMAARKLRHDFLARAAEQAHASAVALAHHADDQLELFFLRLFRGSGGEGLAGMKWLNSSPSDPKIELVRPLLNVRKYDLKTYAADNQLHCREDATNESLGIQRNRIRHGLLPLLQKQYQPGLEKTVLRMMETVGAEAELVTSLARKWLKRTQRPGSEGQERRFATAFKELPVALQRRCLQLQLLEKSIAPDFDVIEQLRIKPDRPIMIAQTREDMVKAGVPLLVSRDSNGRVSSKRALSADFNSASQKVDLEKSNEVQFDDVKISWRISARKSDALPKPRSGQELFDADKIGSRVTLRHWNPGDRFQPIGMKVTIKLQDIFTNQRIPRGRRHKLIVATTPKGDIFWVEGLRISERFKLTNTTIRRLQWRWRRR